MKVSSLVFDLDGTLSDPSSGIVNCVNHALKKHGFELQSEGAISAEIGPPLDLMFRKFFPAISDRDIEQLVISYRERFNTDGFSENVLYDGIPEMIDSLSDVGFQLGVCTSKPEGPARQVLDHFGLLDYFKFVSGGDIGVIKQSQLKKLLDAKVIDENAVMIGDRGVDLIAAHSNGLKSVGVLWGFGDRQELMAESPELILDFVKEILFSFER